MSTHQAFHARKSFLTILSFSAFIFDSYQLKRYTRFYARYWKTASTSFYFASSKRPCYKKTPDLFPAYLLYQTISSARVVFFAFSLSRRYFVPPFRYFVSLSRRYFVPPTWIPKISTYLSKEIVKSRRQCHVKLILPSMVFVRNI